MKWRPLIYTALAAAVGLAVYKMTLPRSIRNNNPLNIRDDGVTPWKGLDEPRGDGEYLRFISPEWGYRAAVRVLRSYRMKHGVYRIEDIVSRWAPEHENPTKSYQAFILDKTGFQPGHVVVEEEGDYPTLLRAMAIFEAGALWEDHYSLDPEVINRGVTLA